MNKLAHPKLLSRLHVRLILYLGIFVLLGVVLAYVRWQSIHKSIDEVSQEFLTSEAKRFEASRATTGDLIRALSYDYTIWDEMVDAIRSNDQVWLQENIEPALDTYKVDAAWVLTKSSQEIYRVARDGQDVAFPLNDLSEKQAQLFQKGYFVDFHTVIDGVVYQVLGAPAQPTTDIERSTVPQGYFFVARKLERPDIISRLESLGDVDVNISTNSGLEPRSITPRSGAFTFEDPIYGYDGLQVGAYRVAGYSAYIERTSNVLYGQYLIFMSVMLAFLSVIGVTIYLVVTLPMRRLSKSISARDPKALSQLKKRKDELGQVAELIVQEQEQELTLRATHMELEAAQAELEKQLRESERMNDLMVGRELRMVELKEQLRELKKKVPRKKGSSS